MKLSLFIGLLILSLQETVPFKPKEEFEIKLQYEFKQRTVTDNSANSVHYDETIKERERRMSTAMLPYVGINFNVVKLTPEETRVRVIDNKGKIPFNKKVKEGDVIFINLGFTDDMKDRVSAHEYIVYFMSDDRKLVKRVVIAVSEDGTFTVNDEKRGKF